MQRRSSSVGRRSKSSPRLPFGNDELVGSTFGRYRILSVIQRGGMGEIFLAELVDKGIRVVLKRLLADHDDDDRYVEMFRQEAEVMSQLDHPNIVKVLDVPIIDSKQCLAMEFVRGRNVQQVMRRCRSMGSRMDARIAVHIMSKVLNGLHEAHSVRLPDGSPMDLVHRDVKPGNVLVSFAGDVKITDFGIAKSNMHSRNTTVGVVKGTTRYLSPEQIRGDAATARSDIFSCASVLVEMLTDSPLFDRGSVAPTLLAIVSGEREPVEKLLPFRAPQLVDAIERALCLRPEDRYATAKEFRQALMASSRVLGARVRDDDVGSFLRQLFQGTDDVLNEQQIARARGLPNAEFTYLVEVNDPISCGPKDQHAPEVKAARAAMQSMAHGSKPLVAEHFGHTPSRPMPQMAPPPLPDPTNITGETVAAVVATVQAAAQQPVTSDEQLFLEPVELDTGAKALPLAAISPIPPPEVLAPAPVPSTSQQSQISIPIPKLPSVKKALPYVVGGLVGALITSLVFGLSAMRTEPAHAGEKKTQMEEKEGGGEKQVGTSNDRRSSK